MPFSKQSAFTKKTTDLPDTPSPQFTATEIKAHIQTPSDELMTTLNNAIDKLNSTTDGNSGADNVGATGFDNTAKTVQVMLEDLNTRKTDKTGNHEGTWQGFTPSQVDQTLRDQVEKNAKKVNAIVTPEMFGAVGDGITDDTIAFRQAVKFAFDNHYTLELGKQRYYIKGNNPFGLEYIAKETDIAFYLSDTRLQSDDNRATYRLNIIGNNAVIFWEPTTETDVFAFVGYLRFSNWKDFFIKTIQPTTASYWGDIFSTRFNVAEQSHIFSQNIFENIRISGGCRRIFSFDCAGTEIESHDDLSVFKRIEAWNYKVFCYINNAQSVGNTFVDCATVLNVDNGIDFHIDSGVWTGGLRVLNHHFTVTSCTNATLFKTSTGTTQERKIYCEKARLEIISTATKWKYFDMDSCTLIMEGLQTITNPNYDSTNVYGKISSRYAKVIIKNIPNVYTPFQILGLETLAVHRTNFEFIGCVYVNGNDIKNLQEFPFITYCDALGNPFTNRYTALSSNFNYGKIVIRNSEQDNNDYGQGWNEDYTLFGSISFPVVQSNKRLLFNKRNGSNLVDRNVYYKIPFDIVIEKMEYNINTVGTIDQVTLNLPNGEMTSVSKTITTTKTDLVETTEELYLKAGTIINFTFSSGGTANAETAFGISSSYILLHYRHPATISEIQKSMSCQLVTK